MRIGGPINSSLLTRNKNSSLVYLISQNETMFLRKNIVAEYRMLKRLAHWVKSSDVFNILVNPDEHYEAWNETNLVRLGLDPNIIAIHQKGIVKIRDMILESEFQTSPSLYQSVFLSVLMRLVKDSRRCIFARFKKCRGQTMTIATYLFWLIRGCCLCLTRHVLFMGGIRVVSIIRKIMVNHISIWATKKATSI